MSSVGHHRWSLLLTHAQNTPNVLVVNHERTETRVDRKCGRDRRVTTGAVFMTACAVVRRTRVLNYPARYGGSRYDAHQK
jgi:hypothetical protein